MELKTKQDVLDLLPAITRFGAAKNTIIVEDVEEGVFRIRFFTSKNEYSIRVRLPSPTDPQSSYMGCTSTSRTPRAGEDWHRGSDLNDGKLSLKTWVAILGDILSYEMVELAKPVKQMVNIEDPK